ncbi:MAG: UDP-2,3-diacylglucosamine diphosphatase [Bacteroidaceae bacterium]|nr:UDP-2,3-diacylglucosamine diphosphatase [Bacteroidaceae bacterium]
MKKKIYFLSDAHLGSWAIEHCRTHERRLVSFLDKIKDEAAAVYMLGDMFDFWYEFRYAVPKGYTRFLGKLSELTDCGVEVHFFTGNHDQWCLDYFEKECGVTVHCEPCLLEIYGKEIYLAHGDEFSRDRVYRFMRAGFRSRFLRWMFSMLHPRWSLWMGHSWARHSMVQHKVKGDTPFLGADKEDSVIFANEYLKKHSTVDCFIFGHRHIDKDLSLEGGSRCIFLGDWISTFAYVVFDGNTIERKYYIEGESKEL